VLFSIGPETLFSHRDLIRYRQGDGNLIVTKVRGSRPSSPDTEFSTAPGTETLARSRRAVFSARRVRYDLESPIVSEDFERLRQALVLLAARGITFTELTLNNPAGSEARFEHLMLKDGQRVGCLIAELYVRNTVLYVFEKQRLPGEHASTLIGRRTDGGLAAEDEVNALLYHRAQRRAWPMKQENWLLRRLNHQFRTTETLADGLMRVMRRLGVSVLLPLL